MGIADDLQGLARRLVEPLRGYFVSWVDTTWIAPTLLNSWTNLGGSNQVAGYCIDPIGFVHLRGMISGGSTAAGVQAFVLPAGYRPAANEYFATVSNGASAYLAIDTAGDVLLYSASATWFSLSVPPFRAGA